MNDLEEILRSELHDVADRLDVPPLPDLSDARPRRPWLPVLAAAAAVLIVLGVVAVVATNRDDAAPQPARPSPTPSETKSTAPPVTVSTEPPKIPYTLDGKLYSGGEQVRTADWWYLSVPGPTWLAMYQGDGSWYWGQGREWSLLAQSVGTPGVSPNGNYVAAIGTDNGRGIVWAQDTRPPGSGLGSTPIDVDDPALRAIVTDDGQVIVRGTKTALLWLPEAGGGTVDLTETAPGVTFWWSTAAGLVVSDGEDGEKYLAEISNDGEVAKTGDLPPLDSIAVTPGGEWMAWTPLGTLGGEVASVGSLEAGTVDGGQQLTFAAPEGALFKVQDWAWEDDDNLIATVVPKDGKYRDFLSERMARCSVLTQSCVLIDAP